ncbi:MAG TPA: 1-phosphofructokinase [Haloplasmataceae bacterium]
MLTITLNPSIDIRYSIDNFQIGCVHRTKDFAYTPGGKGINVTKVITQLKEKVYATGFLGGSSGHFIRTKLDELKIAHQFIDIKGNTRQCIAILSNDNSQTEILEPGPIISNNEFLMFLKLYEALLTEVDIICASGSIPRGLPIDIYKMLIDKARLSGKKFLLDTSGEALQLGIEAKPYLIKPNKEELETLIGKKLTSENDIISSVKPLLDKGINIVVVSLGGEGALAFHDKTMYKAIIPQVKVMNPVGSGDSMLAGFAVGLKRNYSMEKIVKLATACGTANAMEKETGKINLDNVKMLIDKTKILVKEIDTE